MTGKMMELQIRPVILVCALAASTLLTDLSRAGSLTDGVTPTGIAAGTPAGSYLLRDFESINLYSGKVNFALPLQRVTGRGNVQYTITLPIERQWRVEHWSDGSQSPLTNWWAGLTPGYSPGVLQGRQMNDDGCSDFTSWQSITRLTFTQPDGTEIEFRDQTTGGQLVTSACGPGPLQGPSRGSIFVSTDGSAATLVSSTEVRDYPNATPTPYILYPSGYLMFRDGTRYDINQGLVTRIRDRNGNELTCTYGAYNRISSITDSLNRTITITYASGATTYDTVLFKGFGGADRSLQIWYTTLSSALRSPSIWEGEELYTIKTYAQLFPTLNGSSSTQFNPNNVVSKACLPNGRCYEFKYNSYGELAEVKLPTAGYIQYDWDGGFEGGHASGATLLPEIYRRVVSRRVRCSNEPRTARWQARAISL